MNPLSECLVDKSPQSSSGYSNCCKIITGVVIAGLVAGLCGGLLSQGSGHADSFPSLIPTQQPSASPSLRSPYPTISLSQSPTPQPSFRSQYPSLAPVTSIPTTIVPTTSESIKSLKEINNTPYYLQLTAQSSWGAGISCYKEEVAAPCDSTLNPGDQQVVGMTGEASGSSGTGVDYNLCSSLESGNCGGYAGHIHINYNKVNGALSPTLTNNADGTVQLMSNPNGDVSIQMAQVPTLAPTQASPTLAPVPTQRPSSKAPTTAKPFISLSPTSLNGIEKSAWYIDWTTWFNGPPYSIPTGVNLLNVFVGKLMYDASGNPTLGGFGNMDLAQLDAFTEYCRSQSPPIDVKVSVGGGGGSYDNTWDLLTTENTQEFAQGLVDFCHDHGLVGVDFDYEEFKSPEQETLVGTLIKQFKQLDPALQATLCTNAGESWQSHVGTILNAAITSPGKCPIDRLYVMSYYDPIAQEQSYINSWTNWMKNNYYCPSSVTTVGVDTFDANAYNATEFTNWALSNGNSIAHWAYDPAHPTNW